MNQSKGTGKLVGGIFCGIIAVINLLLFIVFGFTAIAIKSEPELVEESLAAQGYGPELMGPVTSVINGFAIFAFAVMVIMIILCVKLCGAYSKQSKLAKQNAAMGYNQFQNGQMPYGQAQNQPVGADGEITDIEKKLMHVRTPPVSFADALKKEVYSQSPSSRRNSPVACSLPRHERGGGSF